MTNHFLIVIVRLRGDIFMEIIETITNLITNVGFPIACCIVLFRQNNKFTETISANTDALNKLADKIERMDTNDNK